MWFKMGLKQFKYNCGGKLGNDIIHILLLMLRTGKIMANSHNFEELSRKQAVMDDEINHLFAGQSEIDVSKV